MWVCQTSLAPISVYPRYISQDLATHSLIHSTLCPSWHTRKKNPAPTPTPPTTGVYGGLLARPSAWAWDLGQGTLSLPYVGPPSLVSSLFPLDRVFFPWFRCYSPGSAISSELLWHVADPSHQGGSLNAHRVAAPMLSLIVILALLPAHCFAFYPRTSSLYKPHVLPVCGGSHWTPLDPHACGGSHWTPSAVTVHYSRCRCALLCAMLPCCSHDKLWAIHTNSKLNGQSVTFSYP